MHTYSVLLEAQEFSLSIPAGDPQVWDPRPQAGHGMVWL